MDLTAPPKNVSGNRQRRKINIDKRVYFNIDDKPWIKGDPDLWLDQQEKLRQNIPSPKIFSDSQLSAAPFFLYGLIIRRNKSGKISSNIKTMSCETDRQLIDLANEVMRLMKIDDEDSISANGFLHDVLYSVPPDGGVIPIEHIVLWVDQNCDITEAE